MANLDATSENYNRNSADPIICESNPLFYHQIDRTTGLSDASVGICFIPANDGNWNDLARWNISTNNIWQDISNVSLSTIPGFSKSTATNWNNFGDIPYILSNLNPPSAEVNTPLSTGCSPVEVTLETTPTTGVSYTWIANGQNIGSGAQLNEILTETGCYDITLVSTIGNCFVNTVIDDLICVEASPSASFTSSTTELNGTNEAIYFYNNSANADSYQWYFGDFNQSNQTNPIINFNNITENTLVTLVASSLNGCIDSSTIIIYYKEDAIFYVPNSFTPDQDEFNQTWGPVFTQGFDPFNFDLFVFNRWGEIVWESHDASTRWDGSYGNSGNECQDGIYTWKISYKPKETDEKINISGHITLIR
jgi:gliding motility-associated-like protein